MTNNAGRRTWTRRRLLAGGLAAAGAVAAAGAGAIAALRRGNGETPVTPPTALPATATPTPAPQAASPTPAAPGLLSFLEPAPGTFERVTFTLDDPIAWRSGVIFMDTATGAMTGYHRVLPGSPDPTEPQVSVLGSRFIVANWGPDERSHLLDRTTGREWGWDARQWAVYGGTDAFVVFAKLDNQRPTGQYVIANGSFDATAYETDLATWSRWLLHDATAAVTFQDRPGAVEFVDLRTGRSRTVFTAPAELHGRHPWGTSIQENAPGTFLAVVSYYAGDPHGSNGPSGEPVYLSQRIAWEGTLLEAIEGLWPQPGSVSPDGRYVVREVSLHAKPSIGLGSGEVWPAVELLDAAGRPLFRVRSAALGYGDNLPPARWLADGSAFIAMVRDPVESPPAPWQPLRYALVTPAGEMELLPAPPVAQSKWYNQPLVNAPAPSPYDPDLLSFGRFYLYNRRSRAWFIPKITSEDGPAHWGANDSPWVVGPGQVVFALGHGGHDGRLTPALAAPLLEQAPFPIEPPMRFRVERTGSCLNLREKPGTSTAVVACLPDGTELELDPDGEILWESASRGYSYTQSNDGDWVLVRAPGGLRGWVSARYLGWAAG